MLDHLLIFVNGRSHVVRGRDAFLSLSDYLRRVQGLTGTKIVCSEGDCGSCTVLVGRATACNERVIYRSVDSCIQFMFQLEGAHIVTIEGLGSETATNSVQRAMIDCHGSQCGFCTPGFVVAMAGLLEECERLDAAELRCGLTGNLCRCTGYTPILEAGRQVDAPRHERVQQLYPSEPILAAIHDRRQQAIEITAKWNGQQHAFASPPDLRSALGYRQSHPDAVIVAGATDIGVRVNKSHQLPERILDLNRVAELEEVIVGARELVAGARASWSALEQIFARLVPEFHSILQRFGGPQIRHVGTIGGNIANASPIADSLPFLYAMDATVELASVTNERSVPITQFYKGYKQLDLRPNELIARVRIPLPAEGELLRLYKVSRRRDLDIASFTGAIRMRLDGESIEEAAIAFGAVGPTVIRARRTEDFLRGRTLDEDTMRAAGDVAAGEISPISDVRGGADYRYQLTRNVLLKFYHQSQATAVPV